MQEEIREKRPWLKYHFLEIRWKGKIISNEYRKTTFGT